MQYSIINDFFLFRVITPAISSESLRFEIIFVPSQTSIQLVNRTVVVQEGESATVRMNFTTRDIAEERLIYSHSGSESRTDRLHLVAESAFRKGRRIPFWMTFSIIPINDNRPRLRGSHVIQVGLFPLLSPFVVPPPPPSWRRRHSL
ncbi:hypothetical protein COOONC_23600 [Cooperia oncophora]